MQRATNRSIRRTVTAVFVSVCAFAMIGLYGLPSSAGEAEMQQAVELLALGEKNLDLKALDKAESIFIKECQGSGRDPYCEYYLARVYLAKYSYYSQVKPDRTRADQMLAKAKDAANQAVARRPNDAAAYVILGQIYQFELARNPLPGFTQAALEQSPVVTAYTKALELDPNNGQAEMGLGIYYMFIPRFLGGDGHRARKHFERAAKLMPGDPEPYVWVSISYREDEDLEKARIYMDKALAIDPENGFVKQEEKRLRAAEKGGG